MDQFELIISQAINNEIVRQDVEMLCESRDIAVGQLYNEIALVIAKRFDSKIMSYEDADTAMNAIFSMMVEDAGNGEVNPFAEPAFSIYGAFDMGECVLHEGEDPVETYTRPAIRSFLTDLQ
ncbi:MAG: hypothetical protein QM730_04085 [Anaerolineales bacterium]